MNTADTEFKEFKAGFPKIVYDNSRSRIGQKKKSDRNRNDLFHFCAGVYQPKEALLYLRHPDFLEKHFSAQIFQFQKDSRTFMEKAGDLLDDIATLNALSSNPVFPDNPSRYMTHHYNDWESKKLQLIRFKIPSRHTGSSYTVYIVYSGRDEQPIEKELNDYPDTFFINRVIDYCCSCQEGLRSLGSCAHVGKSQLTENF